MFVPLLLSHKIFAEHFEWQETLNKKSGLPLHCFISSLKNEKIKYEKINLSVYYNSGLCGSIFESNVELRTQTLGTMRRPCAPIWVRFLIGDDIKWKIYYARIRFCLGQKSKQMINNGCEIFCDLQNYCSSNKFDGTPHFEQIRRLNDFKTQF